MKLKKYRAPDSQQAMRMIRDEQGPDAIILSNYPVPGGVEFVVTVEEDTAAAAHSAARTAPARTTASASGDAHRPAPEQAVTHASQAPGQRHFSGAEPRLAWSQDAELLSLKQELNTVRAMLEAQLKGQLWQGIAGTEPARAHALDFLANLDIDPALGERMAQHIPADEPEAIQREVIRTLLMKQLPVAPAPTSGVVALVGAPGSGKTTTIAKIAASHVLKGSRNDIALLTTDAARIGAQEQLKVYGRILQIPVHVAVNTEEAIKTFRLLRSKKLVLIDTAGHSFRDAHGISALEQLFAGVPEAQILLTLPGDTEAHALSELADAYSRLPLAGAVMTRLDEAVRLGGLLSLLIARRIPAVWCTNGPRVPRHLIAADAGKIVSLAFRLGQEFAAPVTTAAPAAGNRVNARS